MQIAHPTNAAATTEVPLPGVRMERSGASRLITLDRPQARNALNHDTAATLAATIPAIARDADTYAVILKSSRPGTFCAGGDIRELARLVVNNTAAARAALAAEYKLVWLLECFSKPIISLLDGAVIGGGAGITLVNTHRVAAEAYSFAMPEVHIGFLPDDGVAHALARLPGAVGEYLALTGRRLQRADAYALGLVTHCVDAVHFPAIELALANADPVDALLDQYHRAPGDGPMTPVRRLIDDCFSASTAEAIVERLGACAGGAADIAGRQWADETLAAIRAASPLALKVALRHVRNARALDLRLTLMTDYRVGVRLMAGHDFREGVRAMVIDKDRRPVWRPAALEDISDANIDEIFKFQPDTLLNLPTRQEMQATRI